MNKKLLWTVFLILVIVAAVVAFYSDIFRITKYEFNSSKTIHMDVETLLDYSGVKDRTLYSDISVEKIRDNMLKHPFVRDVQVEKNFPNTLIYNIKYREHLLTLRHLDIDLSLDEDMVVLKSFKSKVGFVVEGLPFQSFAAGEVIDIDKLYILENIVDLVKLFKMTDVQPDPVIIYKNNAIYFNIDMLNINFGFGENAETKFNDFLAIYRDLSKKGVSSGLINVSTDGLPVYKPFGD